MHASYTEVSRLGGHLVAAGVELRIFVKFKKFYAEPLRRKLNAGFVFSFVNQSQFEIV